MKRLLIVALSLFVLCALLAAPAAAEEAKKEEAKKPAMPAGQKVFADAKCTMCHTVIEAGIGEAPKTDEEKEKALDGPPDLSMTGKGRTAEWLSLFLKKEETLNDKKHMMSFKGSDEDLNSLVKWLLTLKPAEEKVKKVGKVEKAEKKVEKAETKVEKALEKVEKAEEKVEKAAEKSSSSEHHDHGEKTDHEDDHDDHEEAHEKHEDDHDDHDDDDDNDDDDEEKDE